MDKAYLVHKRKKRYMAQLLDDFEANVGPHVSPSVAENFKGQVRRKMHALAVDACELLTLKPGEEQNGYASEMRDQLEPGRNTHKETTR